MSQRVKLSRKFLTAFLLGALLLAANASSPAAASPNEYFRIRVQDQDTGRGVPLVELRTVNEIRFYTDSAGLVALNDPDLMGQNVYFHVSSPGYSLPKDGFGNVGQAFKIVPGGEAVLKIKRDNIAERLYRMTGAGIYRDSVLAGQPVPLKQPLLNGQVMGQDTVEVAPYRGKIYWFFGDTNRPSYPLGQFATSGATSLLPSKGGLDPKSGVDLTYWVGGDGFSRPMIPIPHAPGPIWVGGVFTLRDQGRERLFTNFAEINQDQSTARDGLAEFNDEKAAFEPVATYPKGDSLHPEGHPFLADDHGQRYLYFQAAAMGAFPLVRCLPNVVDVTNSTHFEAFTCLAPGTRFHGADTALDRAPDGHLIWGWKKNTAALGEDQANTLVKAGKLHQNELLTALHDIDTDAVVLSHGGSVFWNPYRKRWIMITTQAFGSPSFLGEVWFAEADTPAGPWLYARKIVTHDHYTFYNPTQLPFFDQDGGRLVYFQGTYVSTYSDVKDLTPRYDYNQLMYRLSLDDPRLALPAPVYQTKTGYGMRENMEANREWGQVASIPFYAVPPGRPHAGLVPIYAQGDALQAAPPSATAAPLFYALPATPAPGEKPSPAVMPLMGKASAQPMGRVWRNPSSLLALDYGAKAVDPTR